MELTIFFITWGLVYQTSLTSLIGSDAAHLSEKQVGSSSSDSRLQQTTESTRSETSTPRNETQPKLAIEKDLHDDERFSNEAGPSRGRASSPHAQSSELCAAKRRRLEQKHNTLTAELTNVEYTRDLMFSNQEFLLAYLTNYMQDNPNLRDYQEQYISRLREARRNQRAEHENLCNRAFELASRIGRTVEEIGRLDRELRALSCEMNHYSSSNNQSGKS